MDTYLGGYSNPTSLTANEQYNQSAVITIPQGIQGTYYILIVTDANKRLAEFEEENNNLQASFQINLSPSPNLQVTEVIVPSTNTFFSGSEVRVNYEVTNLSLIHI